MTLTRRRVAQACWTALTLLLLSTPVRAEPELRSLNVHGLRIGGITTLIIDGEQLGKAPRLLLPFPAQQTLRPGATDRRATFDITLDNQVVPGYYQIRLVSETGISLPALVGVDALPEITLADAITQLPVALHGTVNGSSTTEVRFSGQAGQKVVLEVEAQRLGSKLRPVIHLHDSRMLQLAWGWTTPSLLGDARLEATLPEEGSYTIAIHDAEYAAAAGSFFRLKIGQWGRVDQVFPPVLAPGQKQTVELLGVGAPARVELTASAGTAFLPLSWPGKGTWSGPRPFVRISPHTELLEQESSGNAQVLPAGPVGVSGRLLTPYEEDRYQVPVSPGSKIRLEVHAERHGSSIDTALVIRNDKGASLARGEDSPAGIDPVLEYTVPASVESITVGVVDTLGRGSERGIYRLVIAPQASAASGFRLYTPSERAVLPPGVPRVVPVLVERDGYQGKIELSVGSLPAGVKLENSTIPEGAEGTLVVLRRDGPLADAAITHWQGQAGGQTRDVVIEGHPLEPLQPWLAREISLAPADKQEGDLRIDWRDLPADLRLVPTTTLKLPVRVSRSDMALPVRLSLITSQPTPVVNGQPNRNLTIREERPVEIAAKAADGEVSVLLPPELGGTTYDLTIQAELLTADKRQVLAVAHAPVRRLEVSRHLVVELASPRLEVSQEAKMGPTRLEVQGKVLRREGLTGNVTISLTGLPAGSQAAPVTLKADEERFTLPVTLPAGLPAGEIRGLAVSAQGTAGARPVRVSSLAVDLTVVVKAAAK